MRGQFAALGVEIPPETVAEETLPVWSDCWLAVMLFLAVETQWRVAPLQAGESARLVYLGLDYTAVDVARRWGGYEAVALDDFRAIEVGALDILNEGGGA